MANLLTSYLLAAIDWDEYKRNGRELSPSTVDWIKQNGKPNIEFELKVLQKAVEREEKLERLESKRKVQDLKIAFERKQAKLIRQRKKSWIVLMREFRNKYASLDPGGQEAYLHMLRDKYSFPLKSLESVAGKKLNGEDYENDQTEVLP
ncbi:hypothetical protein N573_004515 [Limosilactobacillus fermentum 3872]|uniref:Uncharacterized protein n=1 Tax=Limosilactobacillus fermentum 3872 TaxID=1381124 RepID=A0A806T454_LIMFE|nr:hypothetical protein [Limosilactobacillus fermentum]AKM50989.1 hypothetical protein N573_004360 [Limosilactobacillus fermentum 3872]AKM51020.1 hypothetical protein N573_004515 [Limosilactobacillus fermentum 3872]